MGGIIREQQPDIVEVKTAEQMFNEIKTMNTELNAKIDSVIAVLKELLNHISPEKGEVTIKQKDE